MTPTQALVLGWSPLSDWIGWSYRSFCGGCTVSAAAAAALFSVLGEHALVWKLVPLVFGAVWFAAGHRLSLRLGGPPAAVAWAVAATLLPGIGLEASLRGWTNHFEATAVGLALLHVATAPAARPALTAALAALTTVVGLSGGFLTVAAVALTAQARRWDHLTATVVGAATGLLGWLTAAALSDTAPWQDLARIRSDVGALTAAWRVIGQPGPILGGGADALHLALGLTAGAASLTALTVCASRGRAAPVLTVGAWAALYLVSPYAVEPARSHGIEPLRYAIPLVAALPLATAVAVGELWSSSRRALAGVLLAAACASGLAARIEALGAATPSAVVGAPAAHWLVYRYEVLPRGLHRAPWTCGDDARCLTLTAYRDGLAGAPHAHAPPAWAAGRGLAAALDRPEGLDALVAAVRASGVDDLTPALGEALLVAGPRRGWEDLEGHPDPDVREAVSWARGVRAGTDCAAVPPTSAPEAWRAGCCATWTARRADRGAACASSGPSWASFAGR